MRDMSHRCYGCTAEAMTLCQGCAAKSCLDHLTATKSTYSRALLCDDCLARKRQSNSILALCVFIAIVIMLASAGN